MLPQHIKNHTYPASQPLRFPQKLWKIANECQSGALCWSPDGKSILLRYSLFKVEFMSIKNEFFKTDNISSFVRQLNLYGFRKIYDHAHKQAYKANPDLHEFSNENFQRDKPYLLDKVTRKSAILKDKNYIWTDDRKPLEFLDEISCDKALESSNISVDKSDHSYLCIRKDDSSIDTILVEKPVEEKTVEVLQNVPKGGKENINPPEISNPSEKTTSADLNISTPPVKKKRGRKPGSKRSLLKNPAICSYKIDYSPTLKNPENCPHLMYFNDDGDNIYLRNTSRDVMLSSTLPFQETPEYLELKEAFISQVEASIRLRY